MKRHFGRTLVLGLVGLLILAALILRSEWAGDRACRLARSELPRLLGLEVEIGRCRIDPLRGGIELEHLSLRSRSGGEPLLEAERTLVRLESVDPFRDRIRLERVELDRPRLTLD